MTVNRSDFQRRFKAAPDADDRFIGHDPGDGTGDPFVTDLAGLAAGLAPIIATDEAFSSQFAPVTGSTTYKDMANDQLWIPAAAGFAITTGAPSAALFASRWSSVAFDGTTTDEGIALTADFPADWSTVNVDIVWSSASTGDVRWSVTYDNAAEGATLAASGIEDAVTDTLASANFRRTTRITTGRAITNSSIYGLRVRRYQSHVGDTLGADAHLLGVLISRAT